MLKLQGMHTEAACKHLVTVGSMHYCVCEYKYAQVVPSQCILVNHVAWVPQLLVWKHTVVMA